MRDVTSNPLGPRRRALLQAWADHVSTSGTDPEIDLAADNRTTKTQQRVEAFLADPSEEHFSELWSYDVIADAVLGGPTLVLDQWGTVDELASCLEEIRRATTYDPAWEDNFPAKTAVWELYGRLHPESAPIVFSECRVGLRDLGYPSPSSFEDVLTTWNEFTDVYRSVAGHATTGSDHEVPLHHEMSEFLDFVATADDAHLVNTLQTSEGYYPLVNWRAEGDVQRDVQLRGHEEHLDGYVQAKRRGGLERDGPDDTWVGNHWESWKDAYREHFRTVVEANYDLTDLDPDSVESLLDDLNEPTTLSTPVPAYMLGGRSGGILWSQFKDRSLEDPAETAAVLSYLFDEAEDLGVRLDRFVEHYGTINESGGQLMSLATVLLTFPYPREYTFYKWSLMNSFFEDFADYSVDSGFSTSQYWKLNVALREQVLPTLDQHLDDATLLDVHTLLYVYHNEYAG